MGIKKRTVFLDSPLRPSTTNKGEYAIAEMAGGKRIKDSGLVFDGKLEYFYIIFQWFISY